MQNLINILFEKWQGYHPVYWKGRKATYFCYYNIHTSKYPKSYSGYRIIQKPFLSTKGYEIENQYFYNDEPINEMEFMQEIPINHYICRPIQFGDTFVYRVHLSIAPAGSFFDSLSHGYYIRNQGKVLHPKNFYDPFTFSVLREANFEYIEKKKLIGEVIGKENYPYIAREFLVEQKNIKVFLQYMKETGWVLQDTILSQQDVYNQLKTKEREIVDSKDVNKDKGIRNKYIHEIFKCTTHQELDKIKGILYIEIADMRNSYTVLWDEALELKNIYRKFEPLEECTGINLEKIQTLYSTINERALEEISSKNKTLHYLNEIIIWKKKFIDSLSEYNLLKTWILTAMKPMYIFADQLEIKDTNSYNKLSDYHEEMIFNGDKYKILFGEKMQIHPRQTKDDKTAQEQLKLLLEEYKQKQDHYTKRRIKKEIESFKTTLKMIGEIKSLL